MELLQDHEAMFHAEASIAEIHRLVFLTSHGALSSRIVDYATTIFRDCDAGCRIVAASRLFPTLGLYRGA